MRRLAALLLVLALGCRRASSYSAAGDVVAVDEPPRHVTIRHDDIAELMPAMTMQFAVRSPEVLAGITPGSRVRFQLLREGDDLVVTQIVPEGLASGGRPGLHDHTPYHGGVVAMAGLVHVEAAASPDGRVRVYLSDLWRRPLPLDDVTGTVALGVGEAARTFPLAVRDAALAATGPPLDGADVRAHVALVRNHVPIDLHFVLPLRAGTSGAVRAPTEGCRPPGPAPDATGRRPRCVAEFSDSITAVATTGDATTVVVSVLGAGLTVWRLPAWELVTGFGAPPPTEAHSDEPPHADAPSALALSPDGREAVVALEAQLLRYAIASGRLLRSLAGPGNLVRSLAWSPDGTRLLLTAFYDSAAHLIAADDGHELRRLPVEGEGAAAALSPDGRLAAVGSEAGPIRVYTLSAEEPPRPLFGCERPTEGLAFAGDRLVSIAADGVLRVWDPARGAAARSETGTPLLRLAVAPGGRFAATAGLDRAIRLHDLATGDVVETIRWHTGGVWALAWAGPVLVSGDADRKLALWDFGDRVGAPG